MQIIFLLYLSPTSKDDGDKLAEMTFKEDYGRIIYRMLRLPKRNKPRRQRSEGIQ